MQLLKELSHIQEVSNESHKVFKYKRECLCMCVLIDSALLPWHDAHLWKALGLRKVLDPVGGGGGGGEVTPEEREAQTV